MDDHWETFDLNSIRAIHWLSHEFHQIDSNIIHPPDFFKNALHAIVSTSQMNGTVKEKIHTRIAQTRDAIYYDLGSKDYTAIKITKKKVSTIKINEETPLFIRPSSLFQQVKPKYDDPNALDKLVDFMLIQDGDKIIFKIHLIASFLESCATPIPIATGSAGSSKSTFVSSFKRIVDPSGMSQQHNLIGFPKKIDDLISIESNRYVIAFDNVSSIDQEMSDELCRATTGGGSAGRKLYTNSDEAITSYKNKICLNGIVPSLNYPDLQTRIINYPRKPLDENNRLSEEKFEEKFQSLLPNVLGCIFTTLQKTLKIYPKIKEKITPRQRLADFETWGECIAQCLGYEDGQFLQAYDRKLKEDTINAKESHVIVDLIVTLMKETNVYEKQVKTLLDDLRKLAEEDSIDIKSKYVWFPKIPNQLTRELVIVDPILKNLGFRVENFAYNKRDGKYTRNSRVVRITRTKTQETLGFGKTSSSSSPARQPKNQSRKSSKTGRGSGDDGKSSLPDTRQDKTVTEMTEIHKDVSPSVNPENRHDNDTGRGGEDDEDTLNFPSNENITNWECLSCGTGIRGINEETKSSGNILQTHQKSRYGTCTIKYYTEPEANAIEEKKEHL